MTSEFLKGIAFSDLLRYIRQGQPEKVTALGIDPAALASGLLKAVLEQIFKIQFFHADTHPGNLLALPGNQVGFVDFGLVDSLDPEIHRKQAHYFAALYAGEMERVFQGLMDILVADEHSDRQAFRSEFQKLTARWVRDKDQPPALRGPKATSPLASYMVGVMQSARRAGFRVPAQVLSMYRALLTAETVASQLGGKADLRSTALQFFSAFQSEALMQAFQPQQLMRVFYDLLDLSEKAPDQLNHVLTELAENRFSLKVTSTQSKSDQQLGRSQARLLAAGLLSIATAVLLAGVPDQPLVGHLRLASVLWGVLWMSYSYILIKMFRL